MTQRRVVLAALAGVGGCAVGGLTAYGVGRHWIREGVDPTSFAAILLTLITAVYVWLTRGLVEEARQSRLAQQDHWRMTQFHDDARSALQIVRDAQDELDKGMDERFYRPACGRIASRLNEYIPFLHDDIRGKVEFCKEVHRALVGAQMARYDLAMIVSRHVRQQTRFALEAHIRGSAQPPWLDFRGNPLPEGNDYAWIVNIGYDAKLADESET